MTFDPTAYAREWRQKHPDRADEIARTYRERHREQLRDQERARRELRRPEINARERERIQANPELREKRRLRTRRWQEANPHHWRQARYGVAPAEAQAMLDEQGGRCAICSEPMSPPHLDHDHATGRVRGFLCGACNHGLGRFRDRSDLLRRAIGYLEQEESTCND